jgi:hypothetical protein
LHTALAFDLGGEGLPVAGLAHCSGREHSEMIDGDGASESDEAAQIHQRQGDTLGIQSAGRSDPAPQTAHNLLIEEWENRSTKPLEDDETQRVRSEIDDADTLGHKGISIEHSVSGRQASGALA